MYNEVCKEHFKNLNSKQLSYPFLTLSVGRKDYTILANALEDRLGCVVLQGHDVLAYVFPYNSDLRQKSLVLDLKLAIMVFTLKVSKHYFYGASYEIYTAHPLKLSLFSKV